MILAICNNVAVICPLFFNRYQMFKVHFHSHTSAAEAYFFSKTRVALLLAIVLLTVLSDQH